MKCDRDRYITPNVPDCTWLRLQHVNSDVNAAPVCTIPDRENGAEPCELREIYSLWVSTPGSREEAETGPGFVRKPGQLTRSTMLGFWLLGRAHGLDFERGKPPTCMHLGF